MTGNLHSKLTSEVEIKGAEKGAQQLDQVAEAQAKVGGAEGQAVHPAQALDDAQQGLNASTEDYARILARIHPALGAFISAAGGAAKVAEDLATKQFNVKEAWEKAGKALGDHKSLVELGIAVLATVSGLNALIDTIKDMKRGMELAIDTQRQFNEGLAEQTRQAQEAAKAYLEAADARNKFERIGEREAFEGARQSQSVAQRFLLQDKAELLAKTRASVEGLGLSQEQIVNLQLAAASGADVSIDPKLSPDAARRRVDRLLGSQAVQRGADLERSRARERADLLAQLAQQEAKGKGPVENLARFLEYRQGIAPDRAAELAKNIQRTGGDLEGAKGFGVSYALDPLEEMRRRQLGIIRLRSQVPGEETFDVGRVDYVEMTRALKQLNETIVRESRRSEQRPRAPTVIHNNGRYYGPDGRSQHRRTVNGESRARDIEAMANGF